MPDEAARPAEYVAALRLLLDALADVRDRLMEAGITTPWKNAYAAETLIMKLEAEVRTDV